MVLAGPPTIPGFKVGVQGIEPCASKSRTWRATDAPHPVKCPRSELNWDPGFRKPLLYPLSYEDKQQPNCNYTLLEDGQKLDKVATNSDELGENSKDILQVARFFLIYYRTYCYF